MTDSDSNYNKTQSDIDTYAGDPNDMYLLFHVDTEVMDGELIIDSSLLDFSNDVILESEIAVF